MEKLQIQPEEVLNIVKGPICLKLLTLLSGCLSKLSTGMSNETECSAYTSPIGPENLLPPQLPLSTNGLSMSPAALQSIWW